MEVLGVPIRAGDFAEAPWLLQQSGAVPDLCCADLWWVEISDPQPAKRLRNSHTTAAAARSAGGEGVPVSEPACDPQPAKHLRISHTTAAATQSAGGEDFPVGDPTAMAAQDLQLRTAIRSEAQFSVVAQCVDGLVDGGMPTPHAYALAPGMTRHLSPGVLSHRAHAP